jgi:hypothetical protein
MFRVSDDDTSRWYEKTRCVLRATAVTGSKAIELPLEVELGSRLQPSPQALSTTKAGR